MKDKKHTHPVFKHYMGVSFWDAYEDVYVHLHDAASEGSVDNPVPIKQVQSTLMSMGGPTKPSIFKDAYRDTKRPALIRSTRDGIYALQSEKAVAWLKTRKQVFEADIPICFRPSWYVRFMPKDVFEALLDEAAKSGLLSDEPAGDYSEFEHAPVMGCNHPDNKFGPDEELEVSWDNINEMSSLRRTNFVIKLGLDPTIFRIPGQTRKEASKYLDSIKEKLPNVPSGKAKALRDFVVLYF